MQADILACKEAEKDLHVIGITVAVLIIALGGLAGLAVRAMRRRNRAALRIVEKREPTVH